MNLTEAFACPKCKGGLDYVDNIYHCSICQLDYPIQEGIPCFLVNDVGSDEMNSFWDKGWKNRTSATDHQFMIQESRSELQERFSSSVKDLEESNHTMIDTLPIEDRLLLNVGCGIGEAPLLTTLGAKKYIGIDYSFTAAAVSYATLRKMGAIGITAQGNAETLPIKNDVIDIVYSNGVLHHTPNTQKTIDEIVRVLKPSGRAVIGLYSTYSPHFMNDRMIGMMKSMMAGKGASKWYEYGEGDWGTEGSANPWTKTYSKNELKKMFLSERIEKLEFRRCGFHWGNAIPKLGKYIAKTSFGEWSAKALHHSLGAMWVITFTKKSMG